MSDFSIEETVFGLKITGVLNRQNVDKLLEFKNNDLVFLVDVENVTDIDFAGLRALVKTKYFSSKFCFYNISDSLFCKIKDCGALNHIELIRKPIKLSSIDNYRKSGEGFTAVSYNNNNNDTVLKLYKSFIPFDAVIKEKYIVTAVSRLGIATPMIGELVDYENCHGIIFERIHDKKSYSRALCDNFENMPELVARFAKECKMLHRIKCDTSCFVSANAVYIKVVSESKMLNSDEKIRIINAISRIEDSKTCLHGDMHYGNIIFTEDKKSFFIDLGDFGYGNEMYDLGILYLCSFWFPEELIKEEYHLTKAQMKQCWDVFIREYFVTDNQTSLERITYDVQFFAALKVLFFASRVEHEWMRPVVEEYLLSRV